ncbi:uncharacterized protein [Henckelia pumila]|uniref:uncharacterized protein n=1 Tax=Henckelia pumila TaxID=405737 RepID=UPI003C6DC107
MKKRRSFQCKCISSNKFPSFDNVLSDESRGVHANNIRMVSCREYYCYKLQIREDDTSVLLYGGRLLQQFVVDMYIKLETTRLDYFRNHQAEMRSELYQGIVDSVVRGEAKGSEVGRRIVLSASFIGGPRDMRRRYLDAMALVRTFGKPDLFITMTCNPEWNEIKSNLLQGQLPQDRPDLTSRVFQDLKDQLQLNKGQQRAFNTIIQCLDHGKGGIFFVNGPDDLVGILEPFGGKVVLGGDFMQVVPVIPKGTIQETINGSLVKSYLFPRMQQLVLYDNMRAKSDPVFAEFLLRVGKGTEQSDDAGNVRIPDEMLVRLCDGDIELSEQRLIDVIFPDLMNNCHSYVYMTNRAILATKNCYVDKLNDKIISLFPGEVKTYLSFDEDVDDTQNFYPEEFLNSLAPNGLPPHCLLLKKNCPVMLLRNLDPSDGLCNGTRMICKEFKDNVIHAEITVGHHSGKQVLIPRIPLSPAENESHPFQFRRKQFPLQSSFLNDD